MVLEFYKYQGTGNDFILLDNRSGKYDKISAKEISFLCDRHYGIGSDGFIFLQKKTGYDFEMRFYNPDGSAGMMCGNGGRCIAAFARDLKIIRNSCIFWAPDGEHQAKLSDNNQVKLSMKELAFGEKILNFYLFDTGAPHIIFFKDDIEDADFTEKAREVRYSPRFNNEGINVNRLQKKAENEIKVRTYERGVEAETLSCGTGVTASALAYALENNIPEGKIKVQAKGGNLTVYFRSENQRFKDVYLEAQAKFVFSGKVFL